MQNFDFNKLVYRKPFIKPGKRYISELYGLDCEAYRDGKPFIFCISDGLSFTLEDLPGIFFQRKYRGKHFVTWRLKYDAGALLYNIPEKYLNTLRIAHSMTYNGYKYRYIPHKLLRVSKGKNAVNIWDIAQYFKIPLDNAARKYLGKGKLPCDVTKFTPEYVKQNIREITRYCTHDAVITKDLGLYLLDTLKELNVYPANLYSIASVGFTYFKNNAKIIDVYKFWLYDKKLLEYACNAYAGGKFEITARGKFTGYEYDMSSAYPYEISNLLDITNAIVVHSKKYIHEASYGFLRVYIDIEKPLNHCVPYFKSMPNYYPIGSFASFITKQEYDYLISSGAKVDIIDGYWLTIFRKRYPYRKVVKGLYDIKETNRHKNPRVYMVSKTMLNSFYGKMVQVIKKHDGTLLAAPSWNIIYGAVITANVRIKLSQIQQEMGNDCIAVHTDSIITTRKLDKKYLGTGMGTFQLEKSGQGIVIACGMYQIDNKTAFRGFILPKGFNWTEILRQINTKVKISLKQRQLMSWVQASFTHNTDKINMITDEEKTLNLNRDSKRIWLNTATGNSLISELEYSYPIVTLDKYSDAVRLT